MIDATLPQPGEHVPLPGQLSLLPDEPAGTEARAALRECWRTVAAGTPIPRIASLRQLDLVCETERNDREFWLLVKAAAEEELGPLGGRRYVWQQATPFETADDAITDEINLMLARVCGQESRDESPESRAREERTMPQAAARKTKAARPPRPKAEKPAAVETSTTAKPELAGELRMIDVGLLRPSPYQTRRPPSEEWLIELGNSLRQDGQLTPCLVRPLPEANGFELIAGHTRTAAAKRTHRPQLECRIVQCDDATARRLVLVENAKRRDLDILEKARALQGLVDEYAAAGRSQRDLADDVGVSQSEISNLTRLLTLPAAWQERLITGGITKTQARELLPWCDVAALWPRLEKFRDDEGPEWFSRDFSQLLDQALYDVSRPMEKGAGFFDEQRQRRTVMAFAATPDECKHLQVRKVGKSDRAFNTALWDSMQHVAEDKAAAKSAMQAEATAGKVAAKKVTPKQAAEQFNKRLYRWKVAWLQQRIAAALEDKTEGDTLVLLLVWFAQDGHTASHERRTSLAKAFGVRRTSWYQTDAIHILQAVAAKPAATRTASLRRILQEWVQHPADTGSTDMPAPLVDWLAEHLGIDIVRQWSLDRSYLELLTTAQLQELAAEWKLRSTDTKRGDLVEWLATAGKEKPCPKAVRGIKAVSLV
ncbi:ParB/RepB/Spo0J family partition protein [Planctellipticum variicoloris]|uniref:ParB/RepB/Spo0J family partition protein n=1 Tax=Planctellipticum variicoloris TaxID=3064265 RepID=UPI003013F17A|nr:ParB/RepB/Spo0J family partition protein [Planctomycetaceae bacterium SH412]